MPCQSKSAIGNTNKNNKKINSGDTKPKALNLFLNSDCWSFFFKGVPSAVLRVSTPVSIEFKVKGGLDPPLSILVC